MTKNVNLLEAESPAKRGEFFDKPLDTPEGDVGRLIGSPSPELVVKNDGPFISKLGEGIEIVAGRTGPAV
jgi:hypothetical protein